MIAAADRPALPRWVTGAAVAIGLHAGGVLLLWRLPPLSRADPPAMLVDLAPMPEAPPAEPDPAPAEETPPQEVAPPTPVTPPAPNLQTRPPEPVPSEQPPSEPPVEPPPEPPPPDPVIPPPEPPPPLDLAVPPAPPLPAPPVPVPPPPPPRPVQRPVPPRPAPAPVAPVAPAPMPPAAAPPQAAAPVAPQVSAAAAADWRARLLARLNHFKRYPPAAQMRRQQGVAYVHLTLLPDGSVQAVRLQKPSGVELLDEEATSLVQRAAPLPPPPEGGRIELVVPIQFTLH